MAITPAQLSAALRVKKEFNLITGAGLLTDLTNWNGLGIIAPDTVAVLLKLIDPTGATVYINAGYDTDSYAAPDFTLVTTTKSFTIPTDVNGDEITGTYTLYMKAQVVDDGDTVTTVSAVESTAFVCDCTATVSIDIDVDYATAVITTTDTTAYGAYSSISRTHTIYPPPLSGLPNQTTNATTNVYSNIVTTTWSVKITSDVTYLNNYDTYTTCRLTGSDEFVVEADTLCETFCLLKKFRNGELYSRFGKKCTEDIERAWTLAMDEYVLAIQAYRCARPQSEIDTYIDKIYELTGLDPDCDCGCTGDYPTPVVPTSIINGTDGTDGVTPQFQNTGVWIQVSTDNGVTWDNLFSLASVTGAAGAAGANGTDGADGVAVLHNDITDDTTVTNALEELKVFTMTAGQLAGNGDMIKIRARFTTSAEAGGTIKECYLYLGSPVAALGTFCTMNANITYCEIEAYVTRTGAATGKVDGYARMSSSGTLLLNPAYTQQYQFNFPLSAVAHTWANALDVAVYADDNGGNAITCELFQVTYYKI
jgi:hypothetical protein